MLLFSRPMRDRDRGGSVLSFLIGRETSPPMRKCNTEISKSKTREGMVWREVGVSLAVSDSENSLFKLAKYFCCLLCFPVQCLMAPCGLQKIAVNFIFDIFIYMSSRRNIIFTILHCSLLADGEVCKNPILSHVSPRFVRRTLTTYLRNFSTFISWFLLICQYNNGYLPTLKV